LRSTFADQSAYVNQFAIRLNGQVTIERVSSCWMELIAAHEILRTTFVATSAGIHQIVMAPAPLQLSYSKVGLEETLLNGHKAGFAQGQKSWITFTVVQENGSDAYLVVKIHHGIYDGWSMGRYTSDIQRLFAGEPLEKPDQFKKFVQAVPSRVSGDYQRVFDGIPPGLQSGNAGAEGYGEGGGMQEIHISGKLLKDATRLAKVSGATLAKTAWALSIQLFTQTDDVVFGEVVSGRDLSVSGIARFVFCAKL